MFYRIAASPVILTIGLLIILHFGLPWFKPVVFGANLAISHIEKNIHTR